jgi:hypothetical protein
MQSLDSPDLSKMSAIKLIRRSPILGYRARGRETRSVKIRSYSDQSDWVEKRKAGVFSVHSYFSAGLVAVGFAAGLGSVGLSIYFPDFISFAIFSLSFAISGLSDPLYGFVPSSASSLQPTKEKARTTPAIPKQNRHIDVNSRGNEESIE